MNSRVSHLKSTVSHQEIVRSYHLIGRVIEVVSAGLIKVRLLETPDSAYSRSSAETVMAQCLEHVIPIAGGIQAMIGRLVLLVSESGDVDKFIAMGILVEASARAQLPVMQTAVIHDQHSRAAHIDGKRVVLEAAEQIVLQCGKGSITLTADGRIVIKGTDLVSRAVRTHKIKGGTVDIN